MSMHMDTPRYGGDLETNFDTVDANESSDDCTEKFEGESESLLKDKSTLLEFGGVAELTKETAT